MFSFVSGFSQHRDSLPNGATLQGLKMAFITKQLALTTDESQKFWPVYFNYSDELRKSRQTNKDDVLGMEEEMLNVRKKYKSEFKKVLNTDERVNKLLTADRDFNNEVRKEIQKRAQMRNKGMRTPPVQ
jgi:hypothetical protein